MSLTLFVGSNNINLAKEALLSDASAYLITQDNLHQNHTGVCYTSIGDLGNLNNFSFSDDDPKNNSNINGHCITSLNSLNDGYAKFIELIGEKNNKIIEKNKLGTINFCNPELGRWSTVGGLGVMVDELAYGLALLGQEVWVISPYYEKNRKGETGYLAKDPAGIEYKENITVTLNTQYILGVHEGEVNGVKVIFLHNSDIFPANYGDGTCIDIVRQLAVFGKGCLEFCCQRNIIPSVCITNDWFTALVPAYAKVGAFGDTFKGTTFLHIAHNL